MSVRVLLVDDHQIILDSLSLLISTIPGIQIVGTINDSRKVLGFLQDHSVDILITDYSMPYLSGIELTLKVRDSFPSLPILMLTVSEQTETIRQAFQAGISGYVMKKANKAELERAITVITKGQKHFSDSIVEQLLSPSPTNAEGDANDETEVLTAITTRELEIIKLIAQEYSTAEIADKLFITTGTVETHRHNIFRKLKVKNAIGIAKYAIKNKLV